MADDSHEENEITTCPVCWESYEETGDHIPRILPCTHTLCEKCVTILLGNQPGKLMCTECRATHPAKNQVRTFPQNKYVLIHIRRKKAEERTKKKPVTCKAHDQALTLFCKNCKKYICPLCLLKEHRFHDVSDGNEEKNQKSSVLATKLEFVTQKLISKKAELLNAKEEAEKKKVCCVAKLQNRKKQIKDMVDQKFDKLIEDVGKQNDDDINEKLAAIDENLRLLDSIRENSGKPSNTNVDISDAAKTMKAITLQVKSNFSGAVHYRYPEYTFGKYMRKDLQRLCGNILQTECIFHPSSNGPPASVTTSTLALQFKCKGMSLCYRSVLKQGARMVDNKRE